MWKLILASVVAVVSGQVVHISRQEHLLVSAAARNFSEELNDKIAVDRSNVIYSPFSIHCILTMIFTGAHGDTAKELADVLHLSSLPFYGYIAHDAYHNLMEQLTTNQDVNIKLANALFFGAQESLEPAFALDVRNTYFTLLQLLDLTTPQRGLQEVNDYVAKETNNKIKSILTSGDIDSTTRVLLVTTPFINGSWEEKFYSPLTYSQTFTQSDGDDIQVEMMSDNRAAFVKSDYENGVDVVELPLKGGRIRFYIAVPHKINGLPALEKLLSWNHETGELFKGLEKKLVRLDIPKFKISTKFVLKNYLQDLGVKKAFIPHEADFTGIDKLGDIVLSNVIHQTYIDINEEGIVDSVYIPITDSNPTNYQLPDQSIIADHPFLFFLVDSFSDQILLRGKFCG